MSFPLRLEDLFQTTAPLPHGGKQHLRAIWEAHSSTDSRVQQERLIWRLSVARVSLAAITVIGSLVALTQYRYWWAFLLYIAFKLAVTWPLLNGIDRQLSELQEDPDSDLWRGWKARKLAARFVLLLLFAPFWVVRLLGRARDRARTWLEFEIILQGRGYSFRDIAQDPRYRATVAVMRFLQEGAYYRHVLEFPPTGRSTQAGFLDQLARSRLQALSDFMSLAASFEAHPLGTPELADQGCWDQIEQKYSECARVLEKYGVAPRSA